MNVPFSSGGRRRGSHRGPFGGPFGGPFDRPFEAPFEGSYEGSPIGPDAGPFGGFGRSQRWAGPVGFSRHDGPPPPPPPPGPGFGRRGPGGFGPGGFGPGGWGPAGPGGPGGRGGPGRHGHRGWGRGGRGRRGNVRAAVLALLAEEPRHGYAVMTELAERSGGLWRPSPGSVYPVLQQLQDEGLVSVEESEGRRIFSLTEAGLAYVAAHPDEVHEPWNVADSGPLERVQSIMFAVQALGAAADQVARIADDAQAEKAVAAIDQARKALYRILAGEDE